MGSKLINHTLKSLVSGVSQQYAEEAFESQVKEMVNCMPSIARGVLRRNPIKENFQLYSDIDGTTPLSILPTDYVYTYDRGTALDKEQYLITISRDAIIRVYNLTNNDGKPLYVSDVQSYLTIPSTVIPKDSFDMVTVGDHSFIVNKTIVTTMKDITDPQEIVDKWSNCAFYWIKKTTGVVVSQKTTGDSSSSDSGSIMNGYTYTLNGVTKQGYKATTPYDDTKEQLTSSEIAVALVTGKTKDTDGNEVDAYPDNVALGTDYKQDGAFILTNVNITQWEWEDSFGNQASLGVWKEIDDPNRLPAKLPKTIGGVETDGFIVRVSEGTSTQDDDYFLKYNANKETWTECRSPLTTYQYDYTTMPHVLYGLDNNGSRTFIFDEYKVVSDDGSSLLGSAWEDRKAGDEETNDTPSFIGSKIIRIFFHKNRLGFLTTDNIILSGTGAYGNFFSQTVQDVLDDDPIDIAVSTTNVTSLRDIATTSGSLILFSDDAQFVLDSNGGTLTPSSVDVKAVSKYTYNAKVRPKALGNKVYFTSISGGYAQLFSYKLTDRGAQVTEATPLTVHIPSYISSSVCSFVGHDVLGYNFMQDMMNLTTLYVLTNTSLGSKDLQNAFHKWVFDRDIVYINIINNSLYLLFADGSLGYIELEIAGDITKVLYSDVTLNGNVNYSSYLVFHQFFWRDSNERGTSRGRLQLRTLKYTIKDFSAYETIIVDPTLAVLTPEEGYEGTDLTYKRVYKNDSKVTVMANTKNVEIQFKENVDTPTKGFELATVNIEMLYHQRSARV